MLTPVRIRSAAPERSGAGDSGRLPRSACGHGRRGRRGEEVRAEGQHGKWRRDEGPAARIRGQLVEHALGRLMVMVFSDSDGRAAGQLTTVSDCAEPVYSPRSLASPQPRAPHLHF